MLPAYYHVTHLLFRCALPANAVQFCPPHTVNGNVDFHCRELAQGTILAARRRPFILRVTPPHSTVLAGILTGQIPRRRRGGKGLLLHLLRGECAESAQVPGGQGLRPDRDRR